MPPLRSFSLLHRGALGDSGRPGRGRFQEALSFHSLAQSSTRSHTHPLRQCDLEVTQAPASLHLAGKPNALVGPKRLAPPDARSPLQALKP